MDEEIDYSQHSEPELADMFGRMDRRYDPADCARLANFLTERGYIVTDGDLQKRLAGVDDRNIIQAMGSTSERTFVIFTCDRGGPEDDLEV